MITLYDYLPSQNAWKVRALLNQLHLPFQQKFVSIFEGDGQHADYLCINPSGAVPAIRLDNGRTIAESNAILFFLAQNTPYLPNDAAGQSQVLQWLFFEADYVQAGVATLRHWVLTGKDKNRSQDILQSKHVASIKTLHTLNSALNAKPFLCGGKYTIADLSVFAYVHLAEDAGLDLAPYSNVNRWIESVMAQPYFLHEMYPYSIDEHSFREL